MLRLLRKSLGSPRATRLFFDLVAPIYRWLTNNPLWRSSLHEMSRHFPPSGAELVLLDVGCGPGNSAFEILSLRADLRIIGLDFSARMLKLALFTARRRRDGGRTTWAQGDVTRLPFPDSSVDAITGHSLYYMLDDREAFLREALRVLRPGGRIILLDPQQRPYPWYLLTHIVTLRRPQISLALMMWHAVSRLHRRFTLEEMSERLQSAGFARVLAENTVEGFGVMSRGEKPFATPYGEESGTGSKPTTAERIQTTVARDQNVDRTASDSLSVSELMDMARGRTLFLLIRQTPNKPAWSLQPGEVIRWEAATVTDTRTGEVALLVFSSLPKAVAFMQPTVKAGKLNGVTKIAKFSKESARAWASPALLNPPDSLPMHFTFDSPYRDIDPHTAITGEE
jgi:ubiquinone/menaquinone biosynthesis C-methylase UbiE